MTNEDFWHGELNLVKAYRKASKIRLEMELHHEWRSGLYQIQAIASTFVKGNRYPEKPIFSTQKVSEEDRQREEFEKQVAATNAYFERLKASMNAKAEKESAQSGE